MKKVILLSLVAASLSAHAAQERVKIPSDPNATFTIIERSGKGRVRTIVTKREGSSGVSYSRRQYDCQAATWKYLGTGDTPAKMNSSKPENKMTPVHDGSIASYVGGIACDGYNPHKTLSSK